MKSINSNKKKGLFDEIYEKREDFDEFEYYLREPPINAGSKFDVLQYWVNRGDSPLKRMAIDILSIPASSTDVERLFSSAKMDDNKLRQRLEPRLKGDLQVAKSWYLLEENIKNNID